MAVQAGLPKSLPPLFGREEELARLHVALRQTRLLTLTGPGGGGKTRLAQQLACDVHEAFPDGIWWVDLTSLVAPDALAERIRAALGALETPQRSAVDHLTECLGERKLLLVLDNCEHIIEAIAYLCEALLQACPRTQILATSREALGASYELVWSVPPLAAPPKGLDTALTDMGAYAAAQLFNYRARSVQPSFVMSAQNRLLVARICRRLDGLPLALELAASCLNTVSIEQLDAELAETSSILVHGRRTAPLRHRSLEATIEWSYSRLGADEQALFRRLCALRDAFDLELAAHVGDFAHGAMLNLLKRLVDKSLIQVMTVDDVPRYRILQTLAQFGRERLRQDSEECETYERYCAWGLALMKAASRAAEDQCGRAALDRLEREIGHLRWIIQWMLDNKREQDAVELVTALQGFWRERGSQNEARRWLEAGLTGHRPMLPPLVRARALNALGVYASWQGDYHQAKSCCREALQIFVDLRRPRGVAMSLFRLGSAEQRAGEYKAAETHLSVSLETFVGLGDVKGIDVARYGLGLVALAQGAAENAISQLEACLDSLRARGDLGGCAATLISLGVSALECGAFGDAEGWLRESLEYNRALRDTFAAAYALVYLAQAGYLQGRLADMRECLGEALSLANPASTPELLARLLDGHAVLAARDGDLGGAAKLWGASEAIQQAHNVRYWPVERERHDEEVESARRRASGKAQEHIFATAWAAGQALALEVAFALATSCAQMGVVPASELNAENAGEMSERVQLSARVVAAEAPVISPLRIHALGAVHIQRGEYEVTQRDFTYTKARELLFYLLYHGPRAKQQIGLALWPDISEEQLRATFRVVIYHLRRALGRADRIRKEHGRYLIVREVGDWYDVEAFEKAVSEAERCPLDNPEEGIARLEAARALYRGDFCEGMMASDWLIEAQGALRRKQITTLIALGHTRLEHGHARQALDCFKEALGYDRYCEDAHRGVLRSYLLLDEHSQAARYYQQLCLLFERELGVAPASATRAILQSAC